MGKGHAATSMDSGWQGYRAGAAVISDTTSR